MEKMVLGRTGLEVGRLGFGALPIQRANARQAHETLNKAYASGFTFFDTARMYTDSEEKIGSALSQVRQHIVIASKTTAQTVEGFFADLHTSLVNLKTDYLDILQFHFAQQAYDVNSAMYQAMLQAQSQGKIRFIGLSAHALPVARQALESGLYDVVQFPLSLLSTEQELELIDIAVQRNVGLLAMKGLAGGVVRNIPAAFSFLYRFRNLLPLWGIAHMHELDEFLQLAANPPVYDTAMRAAVLEEKAALGDGFCRGCGYCQPCPVGIEMLNIARIALIMQRMPRQLYATEQCRPRCGRPNNAFIAGNAPPAAPMSLTRKNWCRIMPGPTGAFCVIKGCK